MAWAVPAIPPVSPRQERRSWPSARPFARRFARLFSRRAAQLMPRRFPRAGPPSGLPPSPGNSVPGGREERRFRPQQERRSWQLLGGGSSPAASPAAKGPHLRIHRCGLLWAPGNGFARPERINAPWRLDLLAAIFTEWVTDPFQIGREAVVEEYDIHLRRRPIPWPPS
jgi:hypothetical protein